MKLNNNENYWKTHPLILLNAKELGVYLFNCKVPSAASTAYLELMNYCTRKDEEMRKLHDPLCFTFPPIRDSAIRTLDALFKKNPQQKHLN